MEHDYDINHDHEPFSAYPGADDAAGSGSGDAGGDFNPCFLEQGVQYKVEKGGEKSINPEGEQVESALECRRYCKTVAGATFFTYNTDESVSKKLRGECRCKRSQAGRRAKGGMISGNVDCDDGK